jgi:hypothetical protein
MDNIGLVTAALAVVVIGIGVGAWVVVRTPDGSDMEISKVRFAAATFTGILLLIVFASVLFYTSPDGPGKDIFTAIVPAVTPIVGAVIGYLFATKK